MKKSVKVTVSVVASVVALGAAFGIGHATGDPTKDVTATRIVTRTVTRTVTKDVPGPVQTKTVYEPASDGPVGTKIATYTGTGNESTPSFQAPASGDYVIAWSFSGNDEQGDGGDNFVIQATDQQADALGLPNDIQTSGSGNTEITGASGTESFNVTADQTCNWTITITSAS
jgi:hypothetical protein